MYNVGTGKKAGNFLVRPFEGLPKSLWMECIGGPREGEGCEVARAHFEAAVAPLDQLTEQHAEAVERYFGENF